MDHFLNSIGIIIFAAAFCQYLSWRLRLPNIILLTSAGLLLGPVSSLVNPQHLFGENLEVLIELVVVVLLFEGGLNLKFDELKGVSSGVNRLISFGLILNGTITSLAAHYIGKLSWPVSLIIGSILVVTGPTVIIPILRHVNLGEKLSKYLKWEAIVNDPLGILLTTCIYQYLAFQADGQHVLILFSIAKAILISAVITFSAGYGLKYLFDKTQFPDFLKVPTVLSTTLLVFIVAKNFQDGAGLLAVTSLGVFYANKDMLVIKNLKKFNESISVFSVSLIFILMASSIDLKLLTSLKPSHLLFIVSVLFVTRMLAIVIATFKSDMKVKESVLVGFFGPRGIVAASIAGIIGVRLEMVGIPDSEYILPIVFAVICSTVLVHSSLLGLVAKLLDFNTEKGKGLVILGSSLWSLDLAKILQKHDVKVLISDSNWDRLKHARYLGLNCHYGEIVQAVQEGEINLGAYSNLLACTDNNSYNIYACNFLAEDFGLNNVHQIPIENGHNHAHNNKQESQNKDKMLISSFTEKSYYGWGFKATPITKEFKLEDFKQNPDNHDAVFVMLVKPSKSVRFVSDQDKLKVSPGELLISFYDKSKAMLDDADEKAASLEMK